MPPAAKAIKLTLLINSERTHRPIHRLITLSRHCHRQSQTHSRTSDSAKCERLSDRSHALTIPALLKESCIEDMLAQHSLGRWQCGRSKLIKCGELRFCGSL